MANFEIPEILEYIDRIRKLEPTDPAHADLFNAMFQALINNGAFLKKMQEKQAADAQEQTQQQYEQLTGYTDMKIGELINGAPETLDTIKEVADAILENETIVEALNEAVGKKLNKDGDLTDTTVTFTSEDDENPTTWTAMRKVVSGKLKDILGSVSIMAKNLNYLRKMLGTDDISMLGNGTLTGAVSKLNTDLQGKTFLTPMFMANEDGYLDCNDLPIGACAYAYPDTKNSPSRETGWKIFCYGAVWDYVAQIAVSYKGDKLAFRASWIENGAAIWGGWTILGK